MTRDALHFAVEWSVSLCMHTILTFQLYPKLGVECSSTLCTETIIGSMHWIWFETGNGDVLHGIATVHTQMTSSHSKSEQTGGPVKVSWCLRIQINKDRMCVALLEINVWQLEWQKRSCSSTALIRELRYSWENSEIRKELTWQRYIHVACYQLQYSSPCFHYKPYSILYYKIQHCCSLAKYIDTLTVGHRNSAQSKGNFASKKNMLCSVTSCHFVVWAVGFLKEKQAVNKRSKGREKEHRNKLRITILV